MRDIQSCLANPTERAGSALPAGMRKRLRGFALSLTRSREMER